MHKFSTFTIGIVLLLATSIGANAAMQVFGMDGKPPTEFGTFVDDIAVAKVIFIGDTHDDSKLHAEQLEIMRALYAKNPRFAIGLEMFTTDSQKDLDDWSKGKLEEKEFVTIYARNWSYDWSLYRDLFIFARDNHIPMIALNVPKPLIAKVLRQGAQALSESDRKELPPGGAWTLHPRQAEYLKRIREQVFGKVPPRFSVHNFNEAQALRNHSIAYNVANFLKKFPKSKVVVIAGTWHAIKNGAPDSLKEYYGGVTYKVVLQDLKEFVWLKPTIEDVDYLIPREKQ